MFKQPVTSVLSLALPLSDTLDLVSPKLVNHHRRVALIAYLIGAELQLPLKQRRNLLLAGVFHDIGALSMHEKLDFLAFEIANPHTHAEIGYQLLRNFYPFSSVAGIVRHHHVPWNYGEGKRLRDAPVSQESHIIHLADRIAVMIPDQMSVLGRAEEIMQAIRRKSGELFVPELVDCVGELAKREHFWLDAASAKPTEPLHDIINLDLVELGPDGLQSLTELFSQVIDFRSPFTAAHSAGVAACAEMLAKLAGFSGKEQQLIRMAGHLHDLGKLAVPEEILEKKGPLNTSEWNYIRTHTFFGFRALQKIPLMETINIWGSLHHERLDGSGYPFHLRGDEIPLGSRIMAVADVFTALTEDRPYRQGMQLGEALAVLDGMAGDGAIDGNIVGILTANIGEVVDFRRGLVKQAYANYRRLFNQKTTAAEKG